MALYGWRGTAFDSPILTINPQYNISIVTDIAYQFGDYVFLISHVRLDKTKDGKETGQSLVVPREFVEDIFEVTEDELAEFMREKYEVEEIERI